MARWFNFIGGKVATAILLWWSAVFFWVSEIFG
jgi:hypothetical protein